MKTINFNSVPEVEKICLKLIRDNQDFRDIFLSRAADIYADVISFVSNPDCSCKNKVINFIHNNFNTVKEIVKAWVTNNPDNSELVNDTLIIKEIPVGGKIFTINKTEEDFNKFFQKVKKENWTFQAFTILEKEHSWVIFFL